MSTTTSDTTLPYVLSPSTLAKALESTPAPVPLCASWFLPNDPESRSGHASYLTRRIPGARFFDLDAIKGDSPLPHMMPTPERFADAMCELGISNTDRVVVYDTAELGLFSAPRVAWMFRAFGHRDVHVLNNFKTWVEQGLPTEGGEVVSKPPRSEYKAPVPERPGRVVDYQFVRSLATGENVFRPRAKLLDARPAGRFTGDAPEPRPGLPSGHIPGSVSMPFGDVLDAEAKTLLPREKLREVFQSKGVGEGDLVISSCGTGVTAAVVDLALMESGVLGEEGKDPNRLLYDGSWTEWAQRVGEEGVDGLIVNGE